MVVRHEGMRLDYPRVRERLLQCLGLKDHESLGWSSYFGVPCTGKNTYFASTAGIFESQPDPHYMCPTVGQPN